ncbi:MAG: tRNA lysidine(34) synthetase TilS [Candidatus Omnitrophota bacterium]
MRALELSYSAFLKRIKDTIKHYEMLESGDKIIAAVSGGADSVCLLKALVDMKRTFDLQVIVANMDHGLRGKESERDSEFVRKLAVDFGLKYEHKKVKVKISKKAGISWEEAARLKRYEFLKQAARRNRCNVIATGHTIDDQAETVLMRLIFGTSLAGLAGVFPVREEDGFRIIRPLIRVDKKDIFGFVKKAGLEYVEDKTNLDVKFLRNRVRHEILPFLEKYNPKVRRSLTNLCDSLREDFLFLDAEKKKVVRKYSDFDKETVAIKIKDVILQPKAVRREIIKALFEKAGGSVKKLTYRHWMDVDYFLRTAEKNKSLSLPGCVTLTKTGRDVLFLKSDYR